VVPKPKEKRFRYRVSERV